MFDLRIGKESLEAEQRLVGRGSGGKFLFTTVAF
jgi:hypothetical protein